jgi:hypothetical protein
MITRILLMPDHYFLLSVYLTVFIRLQIWDGVPKQPHAHKETPLRDFFSVNPCRALTLDASTRFIHNVFSTYM